MKKHFSAFAFWLLLYPTVAFAQFVGPSGGGSGGSVSFANPTATASDTAVNGVATTAMRSDAAPAVQKGGSAQFGVVEVDGTTITASGGVISAISTGTGNALFGTTTGNTANDFVSMSNTTVGVKDSTYSAASFAPAGQVVRVTGSDPTITAAEWAAYVQFTITGTGRTLTFPASSTLSNNGGAQIDTNAGSVIVAANAADTITWNGATTGAGGTITLPVGGLWAMTTDGAGKLYISGKDVTGTGSNVRATSPTLVTPALGTPSALVLTNATGLVASTGTTATGTPSSTTYLRGDNTWSTPAGGGSGCTVSGTAGQAVYNDGSTGCLSSAATFTSGGNLTVPANAAASTPSMLFSGTGYSGGTATTNTPQVYINAGTAPTSWSTGTGGTLFGENAASSFAGNFLDFHNNGGGSLFSVSSAGQLTLSSNIVANGANLTLSSTAAIKFGNSTVQILGGSNVLALKNNAGTGTIVVAFGNNTSSFPALVADPSTSTTLDVVLANSTTASPTLTGLSSAALTASGVVTFSGVTTGTNADFACFAAGGVLTLQTSACTISSLRFKKDVAPFVGNSLPAILSLDVDTFKYKATNKDPNGNVSQLGLIAEDIAAKLPICAEYEVDMKTPKSYKQECVIAALVKGMQEQQSQIRELWLSVGLLFLGMLGLGALYLKRS